jgi:SCO1/SenC
LRLKIAAVAGGIFSPHRAAIGLGRRDENVEFWPGGLRRGAGAGRHVRAPAGSRHDMAGDECPLEMANIASALRKVPADVAEQIKVVFVTTDPARDSAAVLRSWLDNFDERFIGLTGTEAALEAAGIPPATKAALANGGYEVGYAAFVFAYSKDNLAHLIYPVGVTDEDWAHDLPHLVREGWSSR